MGALSLLVRSVHVLGMAFVLGGAVAIWWSYRTPRRIPVSLAAAYEWLFWGVMGAMLVTGVGNLGAMGAPGPATRWGTLLTGKLVLVLAFVLGSFLRTAVVLRVRQREQPDAGAATGHLSLRRSYAATAWLLAVLVALAEVLAHG